MDGIMSETPMTEPVDLTPTFGAKLLDEVDPNRDILTPDQHKKILSIKDKESFSRILYQNLQDPKAPDFPTAKELFGEMLTRESELLNFIMTWRFYTIAQCMICVDDNRRLANDSSMTPADRLVAAKTCVEASKALSQMIDKMERLAKSSKCIGGSKNKSKRPVYQKPLRSAPQLA